MREILDGIVDAVINNPPFGFWRETSALYGKIRHEWDQPLGFKNPAPRLCGRRAARRRYLRVPDGW